MADGTASCYDDDRVVVVCPFWSGSPYELLVIPRTHEAHLQDAAPADLAAVGRAVRDALGTPAPAARRRRLQPRVPHRAAPPRRARSTGTSTSGRSWSPIAGFEPGTGVLINIVPPELAAQELRAGGADAGLGVGRA